MSMITKINKIKKLGLVFDDYAWDSHLPIFKQFNLVYGWNGSGKTTFSRLFDAVGGAPPENLEYEVEDDRGNKYKQGEPFSQKIRVFNQDYIFKNVQILESRAKSISVLLGEENKELLEKIENDKKLLDGDPSSTSEQAKSGKALLYARYLREQSRKSAEKDNKFTEIAKTIGAAIGGNALRYYRRPDAEKDFSALKAKEELSEEELQKNSLLIKQDSLPQIDRIVVGKISSDGEEVEVADFLKLIHGSAQALLRKTVDSEIIARLASHGDISEWVEAGFHLHKKHASSVCEYCLQEIPAVRIQQISRHFSEADRKLKDELDGLMGQLQGAYSLIDALNIPEKDRFYPELRASFETAASNFRTSKQKILASITRFLEELKGKKSKTTEVLVLKSKPEISECTAKIGKINEIIVLHNKTSSDFDMVKKKAADKVKTHYLSTIFDGVQSILGEIEKLSQDIKLLGDEIDTIKERISKNMAIVSSDHKACEEINKKLATFLGHQELTFVPQTEKKADREGNEKEVVVGYKIMRGEKPAVYLSEGEKTAIAFVYFVVHLGDQDFNAADGIVVIDDPISSLDSNSLYQAFSFLKNAVKNATQVFILTHSFDFLKLLMNWRRSDGGAGYYMIKNNFPNNVRRAYLDKMDKELCEYESEYHYLFKLLKQLRDEQDDSIAKAYPVPNIARKVWDTFLMFSVPNGKSPYKKMEELKAAGRDAQKLDAIYKFTNDQSHITGSGFNPALVPETKKVIKELFEIMAEVAPDHFRVLNQATT